MLRRAALFFAFAVAGALLAAAALAQSRPPANDVTQALTVQAIGSPAAGQVSTRPPAPAASQKAPAHLQPMLSSQNDARAKLGLEPLAWSNELQAASQATVNGITGGLCTSSIVRKAANASLEGLYWAAASRTNDGGLKAQDISPGFVVSEWKDRAASRSGCEKDADCNAFALMTARSARRVGCATTTCPNQSRVWICRYGD